MTKYTEYAEKVLSVEITASVYIKLACQRFLDWLERDDLEFRPKKVDHVVKFISKLKHYTGKSNGQSFILTDWQFFIVENIFGWYYKGTDKRVIRNAYIEVGRKSGKTTLLAAIALYCLMADGEAGAECDCVANSRKQASILFETAKNLADSLDPAHKYIKPFRNNINFDMTKSSIQVLSSDADNLDGFNSSLFVEDELHAAPNTKLYDVLKSSQGMRSNPLAICITSAGFNRFSFCYSMRTTCIEILHDKKTDDSQFSAIYSIDEGDDWTDPSVWKKSNPNLDITVTSEYLQEQVIQAKNNPSLEIGVRTKNFGEWCSTQDVWIDNDTLLKNTDNDTIQVEQFRDCTAYIGIDLAAVSDLTAVSLMIPYEGKLYFFTHYYLPYSALSDNSNAEMYKDWKRKGLLSVTPGNVTDYDYILQDILKWNDVVYIAKIAYDSYNATQFAIDATSQGLPMEPFGQSLGNFNRPTKELERQLKAGRVVMENNEITRFCFSNVVLKHDYCENVKPIKLTNQNKIDGVIAMIEALGVYLQEPQYTSEFIPMNN